MQSTNRLTPSELRILSYLYTKLTTSEIQTKLELQNPKIGKSHVNNRIQSIFIKLKVSGRIELMANEITDLKQQLEHL